MTKGALPQGCPLKSPFLGSGTHLCDISFGTCGQKRSWLVPRNTLSFSLTAKNYTLHNLPCQQAGLPSSITLHWARHCVPPHLHVWAFLFQDLIIYPVCLSCINLLDVLSCSEELELYTYFSSSIWLPLICQMWSQGPHSHSDIHVSAPQVSNWMRKPIQSDNCDAHRSSLDGEWYKRERGRRR